MTPTHAGTTDAHLAALLGRLEPLWVGDPPPNARDAARLVLADYLGTALAGAHEATHRRLLAGLLAAAPPGRCAVLGSGQRTDLGTAAFLNASAGVTLELDDRLPIARMHAGVHVAPLALGVAEAQELPGRAVLRGVVVGYEAAAVLGSLLPGRPDWLHPHGYLSTIAAAIAAACLRGRPFAALPDVVNAAAAIAPLAPFAAAWQGATFRNAYAGFACQAALRVVDCVAAGLSGPAGGLAALAARVGVELGPPSVPADATLAVEHVEMKELPCCASLHPYVRALRRLLARELGLAAAHIEVAGPPRLVSFMTSGPRNLLAAQFSLPFALAHECLRGLSIEAQLDPGDTAVRDLASCVALRVVEGPGAVIVVARDGRRAAEPVHDAPAPSPTVEAVADKYRRLNGGRWDVAGPLWDYVMRLEDAPRVCLPV